MASLLFFCSIAPLAGHVADRSWKNRFSRRAREFKTLLPHLLSRKKRSIMCLIANTPLFGEIRFNSKSFLCSLNYIEVSEVTRKKSSFWIPALYGIQDIPNGSIVSDRITTCLQKKKKTKLDWNTCEISLPFTNEGNFRVPLWSIHEKLIGYIWIDPPWSIAPIKGFLAKSLTWPENYEFKTSSIIL